ncbi:diguanylate cyclase domain-containing protein [Actinoplanes sp. NPDC049681]|uniref:diguanylate cyclase domain-containing protein n=1 Tax=Actinoplanes sp. NPDC049681 TaxID=3363905 RepID=UPI0037A6C894
MRYAVRGANAVVVGIHAVAVLIAGFWLFTTAGGPAAAALFANVAEAGASLYAAIACGRSARRTRGRGRRAWAMLGLGAATWSAGQFLWTWYENVQGIEVPFPSLADLGFLALVPLTVAGAGAFVDLRRGTVRMLLDALLITGSMFYLSWATVLGPLYAAGAGSTFEWLVTMAYPAGDVIVGSMIFILLGQVRGAQRLVFGVLGAGYLALAVADSGFAYLMQSGTYTSSSFADFGWICGFLLIGLAAGLQHRCGPLRIVGTARTWVALPYVPLTVAIAASLVVTVQRGTVGPMLYTLSTVLVVVVVIRQLLSMRDNHRLTMELRATVGNLRLREVELRASQEKLMSRQEELRRLAFTDMLTGVANRSGLFRHLDTLVERPGGEGFLSMLYVDLDGFKDVNDTHGHAAGDALLAAATSRMSAGLRTGDFLARIGGDEFAIVVAHHDAGEANTLAGRLVAALTSPFEIGGQTVAVAASIGVATQPAATADPQELLRDADTAMYTAKLSGKGRYCVFAIESGMPPLPLR